MFSEKIQNAVKSGNTSVLSADLSIIGNIKSDGILEVEGKIEGDISGNTVTLRETSSVHGTIIAKTINIKGKFNGSIKAEKVCISGKAEIVGNVDYVTLSVEDGSSIFGELKRIENMKETLQNAKNNVASTSIRVSNDFRKEDKKEKEKEEK